jgi:hypothetical protein
MPIRMRVGTNRTGPSSTLANPVSHDNGDCLSGVILIE